MKIISKNKEKKLKEIHKKYKFDKILIKSKKVDDNKSIEYLILQIDNIFSILDME